MIDTSRINMTLGKMEHYLSNHNSIAVGVSGGSDSAIIVHMIATYFRHHLGKIHFVFCDTGFEYKATRSYLKTLEKRYNIKIDHVKGMPIPLAIKKYGVPVLSKRLSKVAGDYVKDMPYAVLRVKKSKDYKGKAHLTDTEVKICEAAKIRDMRISPKCCDVSKKEPVLKYYKANNIDLYITGERISEGGYRTMANKNCFMPNVHGRDHYMPLFYWDDETKAYYKEAEKIEYSDCYEVWGMKRTGCVGCPCNSRVGSELNLLKSYEPNMYKACLSVFGESYALMDEFCIRRKTKILSSDD